MDEELEQMWTRKDKTINVAASKALGPKRGSWKERWISNETWKFIDDRKAPTIKMEQSHSSAAESMVNYWEKD